MLVKNARLRSVVELSCSIEYWKVSIRWYYFLAINCRVQVFTFCVLSMPLTTAVTLAFSEALCEESQPSSLIFVFPGVSWSNILKFHPNIVHISTVKAHLYRWMDFHLLKRLSAVSSWRTKSKRTIPSN